MRRPDAFPLWFTVLTGMLIVMNLGVFGFGTLLFPAATFPDMGDGPARFPIQFMAARHIAFAAPLAYGLVSRNTTVLATMYTIFATLSVVDIVLLGVEGTYIPLLVNGIGHPSVPVSVLLGIGMFLAPMGLGLWHLMSYRER